MAQSGLLLGNSKLSMIYEILASHAAQSNQRKKETQKSVRGKGLRNRQRLEHITVRPLRTIKSKAS